MDGRWLAAGCWLATAAGAVFTAPAAAAASVLTVTSPDDGGTCAANACDSLRAALAAARDGDTIRLPGFERDYTFKGELPPISRGVTLLGEGAARTVIRGQDGRVLQIGDGQAEPAVTLAHLTVAGGSSAYGYGGNLLNYARLTLDHVRVTQGQAGAGAGVANLDGGVLQIAHSLIDHNVARSGDALEEGGGIYSRGAVTLTNSTIAFNAARAGGGIALDGSLATLSQVTVAWNTASDGPGGLLIGAEAAATVKGSLLAADAPANCGARLPIDDGGNLAFADDCGFGVAPDPQLSEVLADGRGETPVLTIPSTSAAVDRAGRCSGFDQRDLVRPQGAACDAGAYEVAAPAIDGGPSGPAADASPTFTFSSPEPGASFECRLDGPGGTGAWEPCASPRTFLGLSPGGYTFTVRAAGASAQATRTFAVVAALAPLPAPPVLPPVVVPAAPPQPTYGESVVVRPTRGTVKVRLPGTKRYVALDAVGELPLGTSIDVRKGRVRLYAARDRSGRRQSAQFYAGVFRVVQRGAVIELQLRGPVPTCGSGKGKASAAKKKKKRTRRLWGSGRGNFRTKGRYSAATVRGTTWLVEDRCGSTLTRVKVGVVRVRDFGRRRSVLVRAGKSYVARTSARRHFTRGRT